MARPLLDIRVQTSKVQIGAIQSTQLLYMMVDVNPPKKAIGKEKVLPLNLALVIDRSTSMKGDRLHQLKTAANLVIEKMSAGDYISVISYSDRAETVVPLTKLNNKISVQNSVRSIRASGGTEIYQGLKSGFQELSKLPPNEYVSHLILFTDGHTYGDDEDCLALAKSAASKGIGFSAFGIGDEWNDEFLDEIVTPSGGQSGYISEPEQVLHFLRQRIQGLGAIYAQNLRLATSLPEGLTIKEAFKLSPFAQPIDITSKEMHLGAIEGRVPVSILLEMVVEPMPAGRTLVIPLNFQAVIPSQNDSEIMVNSVQNLAVVSQPRERRMPEALVNAVQIWNMHRMNEKVMDDVARGNIDMATKRMENLTRRFKEAGFTKLAQQASTATQQLTLTGKISGEGRKQLKYGTRTLLTSSLDMQFGNTEEEAEQ